MHPQLKSDPANTPSLCLQFLDLLVMQLAFEQWFVGRARWKQPPMARLGGGARLLLWPVNPPDPTLACALRHRPGLQQVPAVGYLNGSRCSLAGSVGKGRIPIPGDDCYPRMLLEPVGQGFCLGVSQQVDGITLFQVHQNGAVSSAFFQGPVLYAQHPWRDRIFQPCLADDA
jgi:hypothetical protein